MIVGPCIVQRTGAAHAYCDPIARGDGQARALALDHSADPLGRALRQWWAEALALYQRDRAAREGAGRAAQPCGGCGGAQPAHPA